MNPKILIGCPTYEGKDYCFEEYVNAVKAIDYDNFDVLLVDNSKTNNYFEKIKEKLPAVKAEHKENPKENIVNSRNILRQNVLDGNYDYFLSLEQDTIPPKDFIKKLLAHNKDIVAGHYVVPKVINGKQIVVSTVLIKNKEGKFITLPPQLLQHKGLIKIEACGLGCILIS
ncbi:glycosyltransferase family 2 protein, partial [Candidatus Woesearchaeota archaeon]|nr:glycosyltransferase family 2 protein [Candidatus Woesearchaeota archaeon]